MTTLNRKLIRELRQSSMALAGVVAIIAIGSGVFVGLGAAQRILQASQTAYYQAYRFADFWVDVKKAPLPAVGRVRDLPAVADLDARIVFDVILDVPGVERPLAGRLISTPERGFDRTLNGLCLIRGSGFSDQRDEEVILSDAFAKAHRLRLGDTIELILNRKRQSFVIVGTAISPEYVYMVRGVGDLMPDPEHFGVAYVKERFAREVLDFKDACNQLVGQVVPSHRDGLDGLLDRIDRMLAPYGVVETVPRRRQASHRFLSDEIYGLGITATIMPAIFLGVAALVLNVLMVRLVQRQRTIIGTLKALGYASQQVQRHFLSFGAIVGVMGGVIGAVLGVVLSYGLIALYREFFEFPQFVFRLYPDLMVVGMVISVGVAVLGSLYGVRRVLRLGPAEAMRPSPPQQGGSIFLERFEPLWRALSFRSQMALRAVFRNRTRSATGILAATLSVAIIFMALAMYDSFLYLVDYQFDKVAHSDVDIAMRDESSLRALYEAQGLPGVDHAEPILGVRCDLRHGPRQRRMGVVGLASGHRLTTPRTADGTLIQIPDNGLVLSRKLAQLLDAQEGDVLDLTPVRGRRRTRRVHVASIVETFLGLDCYANVRYLSQVVGEAMAINGLQLEVNEASLPALYRSVKTLPNAQGLSVRADVKHSIESTVVETSRISIGMLVLFAGIIAFGSTLNNALIEIGDREREIATMRILGYRPGQVAGIFFRQTALTFGMGMVLAFPLGWGLVVLVAAAYDTELYRMPVIIRPAAVLLTIVLALSFLLIAQWFVYRQISRLDWLEGVKTKE